MKILKTLNKADFQVSIEGSELEYKFVWKLLGFPSKISEQFDQISLSITDFE